MAAMIFRRSWPAPPMKGRPWASSSRPGASPMNINSAERLPSPGTACVLSLWRAQSLQTRTCRSSSSRAFLSAAGGAGLPARDGSGGAADGSPRPSSSAGRRANPAPASARKSTWLRRSSQMSAALFFNGGLDAVEDDAARLPLAQETCLLGGAGGGGDAGGDVVGRGRLPLAHGVGDHEVGVLRRQLLAGVGQDVVGLRGEADEELARPLLLAEEGQDVRSLLDGQGGSDLYLPRLARPGSLESEIGDGGGHAHDIRLREGFQTGRLHFGRGLDELRPGPGRRDERGRAGDEDRLRPAGDSFAGELATHP